MQETAQASTPASSGRHREPGPALGLIEEQRILVESFAKLFRAHSTPAQVREAMPGGFDPGLWAALVEMGVPAMRVAEAAGGLGLPLFETALVMQEAGRSLASAPLVEVVLAASLLAKAGDVGEGWLARVLAGEAIVVPAFAPGAPDPHRLVMGGAVADAVLVVDDEGLHLVERTCEPSLEVNVAALPLARLDAFQGHRVMLIPGAAGGDAMARAAAEWRLLTAALLVGLSDQALRDAAAYARERVAFGRPIGRFQGIAHPLADSHVAVEGGRLLVWKAIAALAAGAPDAAALCEIAWAWIAEKAVSALHRSIRTLGGYGLSLEYDMPLYHRRAIGYVALGGDRDSSLDRAGRVLFLGERPAAPDAGPCTISFALDDAAITAGEETRALLERARTDAMRAKAHHSTASHDREFHRLLARHGLIAAWGEEPESASRRFATLGALEAGGYTTHVIATTEMVGRVTDLFGTPEARAEVVTAIRAGDAVGALGFSEPGAGSDVFAARTQALRQGDDWIINGQKMFTTAGHLADYVLLLARSEPGSDGHRGLTLFVVPTALPGFSHRPVHTYQDERTNITFFTDLVLPDRYRLGEVGGGSYVMGEALKLEQSAGTILFHGHAQTIAAARRWACAAREGTRPIDRIEVRRRLVEVLTRFEVAHGFVMRDLWAAEAGISDRSFGPMTKLCVTETHLENSWAVLEMAGSEALLTGRHDLGIVELGHRRAFAETIYGGTSEIHRSLIAEQALGLPKSRV